MWLACIVSSMVYISSMPIMHGGSAVTYGKQNRWAVHDFEILCPSIEICHRNIKNVPYGEDVFYRWLHFGDLNVYGRPCISHKAGQPGQPSHCSEWDMIITAAVIVYGDYQIIVDEMADVLFISSNNGLAILHNDLTMRHICVRWMPRLQPRSWCE